MNKLSLTILAYLFSATTFATSQYGVTIENLNINRDVQEVFLRTSVTPTTHGCHTDTSWSFTFKLSTEADKATYSTLLAAQMAGKSINIIGFDLCPSNIEELRWVTSIN